MWHCGPPVEGPTIAMLAIDAGGVPVVYRKQKEPALERERFRPPRPAPEVLEVPAVGRPGRSAGHRCRRPHRAGPPLRCAIDAYVAGVVDEPAAETVLAERANGQQGVRPVWVAVIPRFAGPPGGVYAETAGRSGKKLGTLRRIEAGPSGRTGRDRGAGLRWVASGPGSPSEARARFQDRSSPARVNGSAVALRCPHATPTSAAGSPPTTVYSPPVSLRRPDGGDLPGKCRWTSRPPGVVRRAGDIPQVFPQPRDRAGPRPVPTMATW